MMTSTSGISTVSAPSSTWSTMTTRYTYISTTVTLNCTSRFMSSHFSFPLLLQGQNRWCQHSLPLFRHVEDDVCLAHRGHGSPLDQLPAPRRCQVLVCIHSKKLYPFLIYRLSIMTDFGPGARWPRPLVPRSRARGRSIGPMWASCLLQLHRKSFFNIGIAFRPSTRGASSGWPWGSSHRCSRTVRPSSVTRCASSRRISSGRTPFHTTR